MPDELTSSTGTTDASAASAGSSTGTAAPAQGTSAASTPPTGATSGSSAAAGAAPAKQFTYTEDRSNWVPPDRLSQIARQRREIENQLYLERQRVAALSGVKPPAQPEDPETATMRQELERLYPGLSRLGDLPFDKLIKAVERLDALEASHQSSEQNYWSAFGRQQLRIVDSKFKEMFGKDPSQRQRNVIASELRDFCEADPHRVARYEAQDPTLIDEFWQFYESEHIDPYRRHFTAPVAAAGRGRAALPQGGNAQTVQPGQGAGKQKPKDEDEMWEAAFESHQRATSAA